MEELLQPVDKSLRFTKEEVIALANAPSYSLRDRALFTILYLSASRVSEIVRRLRKDQVTIQDIDGRQYMVFEGVYTEKNRSHPLRYIPVNAEKEELLVGIVKDYLTTVPEAALLFPISRQRAWDIIKKMSGERCHFLRHSRLTNLATEGMSTEALKLLAGWSDIRMADIYTHMNWRDVARLM